MLIQASQLCSCFEFAIMPPIRRSRRDSTRANTLASGAVNNEISGAANNVNANYENHRVQPANPANSAAPAPAPAVVPEPGGNVLSPEQMQQVSRIVQEAIDAAMQQLRPAVSSVQSHNAVQNSHLQPNIQHPVESAASNITGLSQELQSLHSVGLSSFPYNCQANSAQVSSSPMPTQAFNVDGGFTEKPQQMINTIQRGEFFYLSQLLPENLYKIVYEVKESDNLAVLIGENNELKLVPKKQRKFITTIEEWTTAFNIYTKIIVDKFPARASELLNYLDIIRQAAMYQRSNAWLMYDVKFRHKVAKVKSLSWSAIDPQLWLRTFTGSQSQVELDSILFNNGPSSENRRISTQRNGTCNNFNRGRPCITSPCPYAHQCNRCRGLHPGSLCGTQGRSKGESQTFSKPGKDSGNSNEHN